MPKAPITYRETFFSEIRGPYTGDRMLKHLEWNRVETELGTMVEPRAPLTSPDATGKISQIDLTEAAASKISIIDEGTFTAQFGTGGSGMFDYNA